MSLIVYTYGIFIGDILMHTKKFKSGNSLAVRIPQRLTPFFSGNKFKIYQKNNKIIIEKEDKTWSTIFNECFNPNLPEKEDMVFIEREVL